LQRIKKMGKHFILRFSLLFALIMSSGFTTRQPVGPNIADRILSFTHQTVGQSIQNIDHLSPTGKSPYQQKFKIRIKALNDYAVSDKPRDLFNPVFYPRIPESNFLPYQLHIKAVSRGSCSSRGPPSVQA